MVYVRAMSVWCAMVRCPLQIQASLQKCAECRAGPAQPSTPAPPPPPSSFYNQLGWDTDNSWSYLVISAGVNSLDTLYFVFVFLARSLDLQSTANTVDTRRRREEHLSCVQICITTMLLDRLDYTIMLLDRLDYNVTRQTRQ